MGAPATFGVDLGGTNVRVALVDADGAIAEQRRVPTPPTLDGIIDEIAGAVRALGATAPGSRGLGVGAAGMIDRNGMIHYAPNVPAFLLAPLRERLLAAVDMPVVVDNDANAAVVGELEYGAARGHRDVLLVTLGTGIGGGIVSGGEVLRGAHGFGAEIGHFQVDPRGPRCACGGIGHWEAMASGRALGALGQQRAAAGEAPSVLALVDGVASAVQGVHVGQAAQRGAPDAVAIMQEYSRLVAIGIVGLVNILDPELVIVSGGLVELDDVLLTPLRSAFAGAIEGAAYRPEVPIVPAALGTHAGVIGAAVLARQLL
ncbi:MAG: ROK family protein [Acidimicrobiia bacterium]